MLPIAFYRRYLSRLKGRPCCRFTPSCSLYGYKAINEWGIVVGTLLLAYRILRCNPFCRGGVDEIPHRRRKPMPKTRDLRGKVCRGRRNDKMVVSRLCLLV